MLVLLSRALAFAIMLFMKKVPSRSGLFGILLGTVIVGLVGVGSGYYALHVRNTGNMTSRSGWQTYQSRVSTAQFQYPASWRLMQDDSSINQPIWLLEHVVVQGPNGFRLTFQVEKPHLNPALSCARTYNSAALPLNSAYSLVFEGTDSQHITAMYLVASPGNQGESYGCGLSFNANRINADSGFLFYGGYGDSLKAMPEAAYANQPEVATAKSIFASFRL